MTTTVRASLRLLAVALSAGLLVIQTSAHAATPVQSDKLDATLSAVAKNGVSRPALVRIEPGIAEPFVETILRFEGNLDAVKAQGARVRSVMGNIATVDIPAGKMAAVAALPSVKSIEASRPQPLRLDRSVPAARADTLRVGTPPSWTAGTGKNVIVGVIDSGIDFRHRDFRNGDGTTRILAIWDQSATGASGSPPAGYSYGGECTPAMINAAIAGDPAACAQKDTDSHGTHVAGIAAGNGQATGNGQIGYRMIGMAPSADLLVANAQRQRAGARRHCVDEGEGRGAWPAAGHQHELRVVLRRARRHVELRARDEQSLGARRHPRGRCRQRGDGAHPRIRHHHAGRKRHRRLQRSRRQQGRRTRDLVPGDRRLRSQRGGSRMRGDGHGEPGRESRDRCDAPAARVEFASTGPQPNNDDRQIKVSIGSTSAAPLVTGAWKITLVGTVVAGGSRAFSIINGEDATGFTFTDHIAPVTTEILTDTSSSQAGDRRGVLQHAQFMEQRQRPELGHVGRRGVRHLELQQPRSAPQLQQRRQVPRRS